MTSEIPGSCDCGPLVTDGGWISLQRLRLLGSESERGRARSIIAMQALSLSVQRREAARPGADWAN